MNKALRTLFVILALALGACQPTVTPTIQVAQSSGIENVRVITIGPAESLIDTEDFPLPNCGGTSELHQTLGTQASVTKSVTIGAKATIKGGGEAEVPEIAKLELAIEVEAAYQKTYESANSRLDTIGMQAAAGTHVVYTIGWYEQTFSSVIEYSSNGQVYEAPYTYKLRIPKIENSNNIICSGNSTIDNGPTPPPQTTSPSVFSGGYCFGQCWQYDESTKTMTWTGPVDGNEDIWQGDDLSLSRIRSGWIAVFGPVSVPGEIEVCKLKIDGQSVIDSCDGMQHPYAVEANQVFRVTSANSEIGGFRWKPAKGYGYRK